MPLLRKDLYETPKDTELLKDSDDVFYCEQTKECFKKYEDYFRRIMLLSSTVWTCSFTGRSGLTFDEAKESERKAKKLLKDFPNELKAPCLMVTSLTKRSGISDLVEDVYNHVTEHLYVGEDVNFINTSGKIRDSLEILEIIFPTGKDRTSNIIKPSECKYKCKFGSGKTEILSSTSIRRPRYMFNRELLKLFLKQHLESQHGMLKVKETSFKKFITEKNVRMADVFLGKPPSFEQSKKLIAMQEKKTTPPKKKTAGKKAENTKPSKISKDTKGGKQQSMDKYLNKSTDAVKAVAPPKDKKDTKKLVEELERRRKEKEAFEAERAKKAAEDKVELNKRISEAIKKYSAIQDDQELQDQRVIPAGKPVKTIIDPTYFSDFIYVFEFMSSFSELLSIRDKFPMGLTMDTFERALMVKEVNGPLSDILQVLLSTIFTLQVDEENEVYIQYESSNDFAAKKNGNPILWNATQSGIWVEHHLCLKMTELPIDSTTISELIRLHFLASGAVIQDQGSKWRFAQRGGYQASDDPGIAMVTDYPHILRGLKMYPVFSLPKLDILKIMRCLVDQIMTYSSVRDLIEERVEKMRAAKNQYIHALAAKRRREVKANSDRAALREDIKKQLKVFDGGNEAKGKFKIELEEKANAQIVKVDIELEKDMKTLMKDIQQCKLKYFDYQIFLGMDRAYRSYWLFESLPGLFVEHDVTYSGRCSDEPTLHLPGLARTSEIDRNKFIKQIIMNAKLSQEDKENKDLVGEIMANYKEVNGVVGSPKKEKQLTNADLMMCTAERRNCPVHSDPFRDRVRWTYYSTEAEIDALIASLNPRGLREKVLRDHLLMEKDLIVEHVIKCPISKVDINDDEKDNLLTEVMRRTSKKYENANFHHESGSDANEILRAALLENILDMEAKITCGCLGQMKVKDRLQWRAHLEQDHFDPMNEQPLVWGKKRLRQQKSEEKDKENGEPEEEDDEAYIPGFDLGNSKDLESEDSQDEAILLYDSHELKTSVKNLSIALLQIEQSIDPKFMTAPFGSIKELTNREKLLAEIEKGRKNIVKWEDSLMHSTNYAQIFLHYTILYDAVRWARSVEKSGCMLCRKKTDPDQTLLCDECNRACHMYCLKPKMKKVPEDDWFCKRCRPENYVERRGRKRKEFVAEEQEEEEGEDIEITTEEDDLNDEIGLMEDPCIRCKKPDSDVKCIVCKQIIIHLDCMNEEEQRKNNYTCEPCMMERKARKVPKNKKDKKSKKKAKKYALKIKSYDDEEYEAEGETAEEELNGEEEETSVVADENGHEEEEEEKSSRKGAKKSKQNGHVEEEEAEEVEEDEKPSRKRSRKSHNKQNGHVEGAEEDDAEEDIIPKKKSRKSVQNGHKRRSTNSRRSRAVEENGNDDGEEDKGKRRSSRQIKSTQIDSSEEDDEETIVGRKSKKSKANEVSPSASRRARKSDDLLLDMVSYSQLLDESLKHDDAWPFDRPVSAKQVPDYYEVIKKPMDLARIKSKLNMGQYKTNFEVMDDINLVFNNCDLYNTSGTDIFNAGCRLEKFMESRCKELQLPFKASDMLKSENGTDQEEAAPPKKRSKRSL